MFIDAGNVGEQIDDYFYDYRLGVGFGLRYLLPIGPLDGSYILPYMLPRELAPKYQQLNRRYGSYLLLGIVALHFLGVPIFSRLWEFAEFLLRVITIV